jgi:hypothetical protein
MGRLVGEQEAHPSPNCSEEYHREGNAEEGVYGGLDHMAQLHHAAISFAWFRPAGLCICKNSPPTEQQRAPAGGGNWRLWGANSFVLGHRGTLIWWIARRVR